MTFAKVPKKRKISSFKRNFVLSRHKEHTSLWKKSVLRLNFRAKCENRKKTRKKLTCPHPARINVVSSPYFIPCKLDTTGRHKGFIQYVNSTEWPNRNKAMSFSKFPEYGWYFSCTICSITGIIWTGSAHKSSWQSKLVFISHSPRITSWRGEILQRKNEKKISKKQFN